MPYASNSEIPDYVPGPEENQTAWRDTWNSAYHEQLAGGKGAKEAEEYAFRVANAKYGPKAKAAFDALIKAIGTETTGFARAAEGPFRCGHCQFMVKRAGGDGLCVQREVNADPALSDAPRFNDFLVVDAGDYCCEYEPVKKEKASMPKTFKKFIPFVKVDSVRREVWGVVTAELPDKDDEVCDYEKSKPYYQAVIAEMSKATNGENFFPLREMHGLSAAGKCIGFDFRDQDREIYMGFKVVDDDAWKKVDERVYTGFSQGGRIVGSMVEDPVFKGCMRYTANPSEVSLVDNPCLGAAHFAYVKSDGMIEMRKFLKTEPVTNRGEVTGAVLATLQRQIETLEKTLLAKGKTKRVAGEDLPPSSFLIVGDENKTDTWHLPVKFSTEAKTVRHLRNALARFDQLKGVSQDEKDKAWKKLVRLCEEHGIDVEEEKKLLAAIQAHLRKNARVLVNRLSRKVKGGNVGFTLATLDNDLGRLAKGMYEVSRLACLVQELSYMLYTVVGEEEWEEDRDSQLPELVEENINSLLDTLVQMVEEESEEIRVDAAERVNA